MNVDIKDPRILIIVGLGIILIALFLFGEVLFPLAIILVPIAIFYAIQKVFGKKA
jgi:hypothetical protein